MSNQYQNPSLTTCPVCRTTVSTQALSCPKCGQPFQPAGYGQPHLQQNYAQPVRKKGGIGRAFGIGCLGMIGLSMIVGSISAILIPKKNASMTQLQAPAQTVSTPAASKAPVSKEKIQRGESIVKGANAKYGVDNYLVDGGMSTRINVYLPVNEWRKLSKEDHINVSYYAESLVPLIRANPGKYINTPSSAPLYPTLAKNASEMCDTCWSVEIGSIVKDDTGKNTILGDHDSPVDGTNAAAFRQNAKK